MWTVVEKHCAAGEGDTHREQKTPSTGWENERRIYLESRQARASSTPRVRGFAFENEAVDYHGDRIDNRRIGDIDFIIETLESGEITRYYEREQYPEGVLVTALVTGDSSVKDEARANAIPEFMRFNIIENEVRNVI